METYLSAPNLMKRNQKLTILFTNTMFITYFATQFYLIKAEIGRKVTKKGTSTNWWREVNGLS